MQLSKKDTEQAIELLQGSGIQFLKTAYGFSLQHIDTENDFAQCGLDNDFSISMTVKENESLSCMFFRYNFTEMADLVVKAYRRVGKSNQSRSDIVKCLKEIDATYDHAGLKEKLRITLESE